MQYPMLFIALVCPVLQLKGHPKTPKTNRMMSAQACTKAIYLNDTYIFDHQALFLDEKPSTDKNAPKNEFVVYLTESIFHPQVQQTFFSEFFKKIL